MNRPCLLVILVILFWSAVAQAEDGKFYLSPQASLIQLDVGRDYLAAGYEASETVYGSRATAGYRFSSNILVEVGGGFAENLDAIGSTFDNYEFTDIRIAIGYAIVAGEKVRLVPKLGSQRWRLKAEEGQFFNPGPEDNLVSKDTDKFVEFETEIIFNPKFSLDASAFYSDTEFGRIRSVLVGVQFEF